jgi:CHASE2 domain-containing sensor protein
MKKKQLSLISALLSTRVSLEDWNEVYETLWLLGIGLIAAIGGLVGVL